MFDIHIHLPEKLQVEVSGSLDVRHHIIDDCARRTITKVVPVFITVQRKVPTTMPPTDPQTFTVTLDDLSFFNVSLGEETDAEGNVVTTDSLVVSVSDPAALSVVQTGPKSWDFLTADDAGHTGSFTASLVGGLYNIQITANVLTSAPTVAGAVTIGAPALKSSRVPPVVADTSGDGSASA